MPDAVPTDARTAFTDLRARMAQAIIGQENVIERLLIALLADGNVLVEGLPGVAKTRSVKALAKNLDATFRRIQFTPDLLPADVVGSTIYEQKTGEFRFEAGPVFGNIILVDEINRAPAKVQSALLEAMEERQVTVGGATHPLPPLFLVMATQNPIEQEGTYPLPEAQLDRFLMKVAVDYPPAADEGAILRLVRGEEQAKHGPAAAAPAPIPQQAVFDARAAMSHLTVAPAIEDYIVALVCGTRDASALDGELAGWIEVGASPRASIALDRASRAHAWLAGQDHVTPENVRAIAPDVLRHRLILSYEATAARVTAEAAVERLISVVAVA
ncbi:AAA domain-containing protein [Roseomonas sp. JC162]|uniref:AAA domain-containing protein n=1 Tax=Neoroseomonas marina TaxID=1232220 RepID=A0A848EA54_9PROT|nr:AAA family ATPase [Neoroseomonas marina]NMJ41032.1 AAA domain-containing protein [Neoroseomonas marina]